MSSKWCEERLRVRTRMPSTSMLSARSSFSSSTVFFVKKVQYQRGRGRGTARGWFPRSFDRQEEGQEHGGSARRYMWVGYPARPCCEPYRGTRRPGSPTSGPKEVHRQRDIEAMGGPRHMESAGLWGRPNSRRELDVSKWSATLDEFGIEITDQLSRES